MIRIIFPAMSAVSALMAAMVLWTRVASYLAMSMISPITCLTSLQWPESEMMMLTIFESVTSPSMEDTMFLTRDLQKRRIS